MGFVVVKAFDYLVSPAPPSVLCHRAGNMGYAPKAYWVGDLNGGTTASSSYAYDAAGCLTNLNGMVLEWDERYRLTNVLATEGTKITYGYDVLGRRVSRESSAGVSPATVEQYVYDGNQIVADLDGEGNLLRSYVWGQGIDNLLSLTVHERDGGVASTFYPIKDHQNTILALVDASGSVAESYEYTAYGETRVFNADGIELAESALGNRYTFQGREIDWATGLIHFRARWYDPDSGRWLSKDPIGIAGGLNLYEFCGNNPVNVVDPYGEYGLDGAVVGGISGFVSGAISGYASGGWAGAAAGAVTGGAAGAVVGAVNPLAGAAVGGAVGGAVGSALGQYATTGTVNPGAVAGSALSGAAGGVIGAMSGGTLTGPAAAVGTAAGNIVGSAGTALLSNAGENWWNSQTSGCKE